ncbi:MAG: amidohydrolase [Betaproteobacteria bacterium]|nr:amidohydrolase [Betaproteobacteria bacterium]
MSRTALRIDTHQHHIPEFYKKALERVGVHGSGENPWAKWSVEQALDVLDRRGIAATVSSISSPGIYFGDVKFATRLARDCNEFAAKMVADHGSRFAMLGVVPLPDTAAACREVEHALDTLKLDGISLLTHVGKSYLGQPEYDELFAELNRRKAVVFLHPVRPNLDGLADYDFPTGTVELTTDTTRAVVNMFYHGYPERYPDIRWILSHAGGMLPMVIYRLRNMSKRPEVASRLPKGVDYYLRQMYFDLAQASVPLIQRALEEIADPAKILFGSDFPFSQVGEKVVDDVLAGIESFDGYDAGRRSMILGANALALFPRLATAH